MIPVLIICTLTLVLTGLYQKFTNAVFKSSKGLEGRVAIVTGGTSGMGMEIAMDLANRGAKVIIACPFEEEGVEARKVITEATGNKNVIFKELDLASLNSIRKFAAAILENEIRLDLLINNAGVGAPIDPRNYNGTNFIMHVNYFGHFLLTILMLPLLRRSGTESQPSRIINTGSMLHVFGRLDYNSKNREDFIYRFLCYCNSKYCCVLIGHALNRKLNGNNVVINAVNPGAVGTGIFKSIWGGFLATYFLRYFSKTPKEGAQTAIYAALDEKAGLVSGQYYSNCKISRAKQSAYDETLGNKLWEDSINIVKLDEYELEKFLRC